MLYGLCMDTDGDLPATVSRDLYDTEEEAVAAAKGICQEYIDERSDDIDTLVVDADPAQREVGRTCIRVINPVDGYCWFTVSILEFNQLMRGSVG